MVKPTQKHKRYAAKACKRKKRYRDKQEALRVARYQQGKVGYRLRIYKCSECAGFHLTSLIDKD